MDLSTHQLTMAVLMTPYMANFAGDVHGGSIWCHAAAEVRKQLRQECAKCYEALRNAAH